LNTTGAPRRAQARLSGIITGDGLRAPVFSPSRWRGETLSSPAIAPSHTETEIVSFPGGRVSFDGKPGDSWDKQRTEQILPEEAFNLLYFS